MKKAKPAEAALDENEVSKAVVKWLEARGYVARALEAGQHGIDVAGWHPETGHRWAIEAKGSASTRAMPGSVRPGPSEPAAYRGLGSALLNTISWAGVGVMAETSVGIACPQDRYFDMWLERLAPACKLLGIAIFQAASDGSVVTSVSDGNPIVRPPELLASPRKLPPSCRLNFDPPLPPYPAD